MLLAAGVVLYGAGTLVLRSIERKPKQPLWPALVDEELRDADLALRLDMIERLALVPSDWSTKILKQAREEEKDPALRAAIDSALKQ